ncbi:MAG: TIGR00645 family protein [Cytophagales bacterium]|nr:TIGR00645 family protein [Cytophagales bacterium]
MNAVKNFENFFEGIMFWSRWVQAPLYGGLVVGSALYLTKFFQELFHVFEKTLELHEIEMMLKILSLIDISMVMNLLVMVTIGGYSIFVSKIDVDMHEDKPLWLEGLDAGQLKIKLATSLASISGVQLLKTFIDYREAQEKNDTEAIVMEIVIHMVFIISALLLSQTEKITHSYHGGEEDHEDESEGDGGEKSV